MFHPFRSTKGLVHDGDLDGAGRGARGVGSNVPLLLEALANGAPALRPAYGQHITRLDGL